MLLIGDSGGLWRVDEAQARALIAREIASMQAEVDRVDADKRRHGLPTSDVEYVITDVLRISETWCVFFNNRRYIDTGDGHHALAGNGPFLVSADGRVGRAGSALPPEHYVTEFEAEASG